MASSHTLPKFVMLIIKANQKVIVEPVWDTGGFSLPCADTSYDNTQIGGVQSALQIAFDYFNLYLKNNDINLIYNGEVELNKKSYEVEVYKVININFDVLAAVRNGITLPFSEVVSGKHRFVDWQRSILTEMYGLYRNVKSITITQTQKGCNAKKDAGCYRATDSVSIPALLTKQAPVLNSHYVCSDLLEADLPQILTKQAP